MGIDRRMARWWRRGLAAILAADAVALVVQTSLKAAQAPVEQGDSPLFSVLAGSWVALACCAIVALAALWRFAAAPARWLALTVALVALGVLVEANGLVFHDYNRNYFFPGAMAAAWVGGLLFARVVGAIHHEEAERVAGAGAAAMLGIAYFNAGVSKLLYSAGEWLNPAVIRLTLVMENPVDDTSWMGAVWRAVVEQPDLAAELAIMAVVMELCGALYVFGWRARIFAGTVMLLLHAGMMAFLHIVFVDAVVCLLFFSFPWPRWLGAAVPADDGGASSPPISPQRAHRAAMVVAALALGLWLVPGSLARTGSVHASGEASSGITVVTAFGPLSVSDDLAGEWRIAEIAVHTDGPGMAVFTLVGPSEARVLMYAAGPEGKVQPGPFAAWPARLAHGPLPVAWEVFEPAGRELGKRLQEALAGDIEGMDAWLATAAAGAP